MCSIEVFDTDKLDENNDIYPYKSKNCNKYHKYVNKYQALIYTIYYLLFTIYYLLFTIYYLHP